MLVLIQPHLSSVALIRPLVGEKICSTMPPMMIQLRKCGRYKSVCETFFTLMLRISLSMIARMIGTGKPATRPSRFSHSVLIRAYLKSDMPMTNLKFSRPTNLLPHMPLNRLYFWKAMIRPIIGL